MRKLPWLIPIIITTAAMAQRGGPANRLVPYVPDCVTTSGSCPADGYICASGTVLYRCTAAGGWDNVAGATTLPADPTACAAGEVVVDIDISGNLTCSAMDFSYMGGTIATAQIASDTITPDHINTANQTDGFILSYVASGDTTAWISPSGAAGDSITVDTAAVVNPDLASTGDIDVVNTSNTVTFNINADKIVNADINSAAAIVDTKLATISTAGKVSNSATTAVATNTVSTIVARDSSGNFAAGTITATLTGTASQATSVPNGAAPTVGTVGYVGVDTTEDNFLYYGTALRVLSYLDSFSFTLETPADADNFLVMKAPHDMTITNIYCIVDPAGTGETVVIDVQECNTTGDSCATVDATLTCANTGTADDGSLTNPTITEAEWIAIDIGTVTGTVTQVAITVEYTVTRK